MVLLSRKPSYSFLKMLSQITMTSNWSWWHLANPLVWPLLQGLLDFTVVVFMQDNIL